MSWISTGPGLIAAWLAAFALVGLELTQAADRTAGLGVYILAIYALAVATAASWAALRPGRPGPAATGAVLTGGLLQWANLSAGTDWLVPDAAQSLDHEKSLLLATFLGAGPAILAGAGLAYMAAAADPRRD